VSINASLPLMYWSKLHELINDEIGTELENSNITLSIVGMDNIKTAVPQAIEETTAEEPEEKPAEEQTVAEEKLSEDPLENIVNKYNCKSASDIAGSMEITQVAVVNKLQKDQIHGFKYEGKWQIPEHDLATYLFSHEKRESGMYSRKPSELNDAELKEYIKEVGMVHNLREASVKLGESQKKVAKLLEENNLHGVKKDNKWYVADKEIEFFKEAGKYVYDE